MRTRGAAILVLYLVVTPTCSATEVQTKNAVESAESTGADTEATSGDTGCAGANVLGCEASAQCIQANCHVEAQSCFGANYPSAQYSGPCAAWMQCTDGCGCDETCVESCRDPTCLACLLGVSTCMQMHCGEAIMTCS